MSAGGWTPNPDGLQQVAELLEGEATTNEQHKIIYQKLKELEGNAEFCAYLGHIFVFSEGMATYRQRAGLLLKGVVKRNWGNVPQNVRNYVTGIVPNSLADSERRIRIYSAAIIGMILFRGGPNCWPALIPSLVQALQSNDLNAIHGSLLCLEGLCQGQQCRVEIETDENYLNTCQIICQHDASQTLVDILIKQFMTHQEMELRRLALECLFCLGFHQAAAFHKHLPQYLEVLYQITQDETPEIRALVCKSFNLLIRVYLSAVENMIDNIIKFMLLCTRHGKSKETRMEAAEFWTNYVSSNETRDEYLHDVLEELIPALLQSMVYSEDELAMIQSENDDQDQPDRDQDINPTHTRGEEDTDDETANSVRRVSARALDNLACRLKDRVLRILLPHMNICFQSSNWLERETAILSLGAVAHGCQREITQYLPEVVPHIFSLLDDEQPLIRCIAAWTLSRFANWLLLEKDDQQVLVPLLDKLWKLVLDNSKRVQQAAISTISELMHTQTGAERLIPYLGGLIDRFSDCIRSYHLKNVPYLCDCLLNCFQNSYLVLFEQHEDKVIKLLDNAVQRLYSMDMESPPVNALLELFTHIACLVGPNFARWGEPVWQRAVQQIQYYLGQVQNALELKKQNEDYEYPRDDLFTCALDFMTGLSEGCGSEIQVFIQGTPNFDNFLFVGMESKSIHVRSVTMSLVGCLASAAPDVITPNIDFFITGTLKNINPNIEPLCRNAVWFIGRLAEMIPGAIEPKLREILQYIAGIINMPEPPIDMIVPYGGVTIGPTQLIYQSCCFTMSRLIEKFPQEISSFYGEFALRWIYHLGKGIDDAQGERERYYYSMVMITTMNPVAILDDPNGLCVLCNSICSLFEVSNELKDMFSTLLKQFKDASQNEQTWERLLSDLDPSTRDLLRRRHGV